MYVYTHRAVESMVKYHPEHVNVKEQMGCSPLHLAATEGEIEVAKTLLEIVSNAELLSYECTDLPIAVLSYTVSNNVLCSLNVLWMQRLTQATLLCMEQS